MEYPPLFQARWRFRPLILCNLAALVLLGLWAWPEGHALMNRFDEWLFHLLNQPLASNDLWLYAWTVASMRPFDVVVGLILLMLLIKGDWVFRAAQTRAAIFGFIAILVLLLIIRSLLAKYINTTDLQHDSPSRVLPEAVRLSHIFPQLEKTWELKDNSGRSFPGDHASVLLIWAMFMSLYARSFGRQLVIWSLAVLFMLPRLVAGAHWGQDDYIGGVAIALAALAWGIYTPYAAHVTRLGLRLSEPLFAIARVIPLVNRMSLVRAGFSR
ncbi:phosphatase PAP2 family protein [uncultured Pseudomonas sp.]|uniref:phosphatase PAP2 family protein n=1 Tax=uncultured Pseudomonas sp. TaxID=114707 RepID=UPI0025D15EBE|nr:phosphatase PAP2 family protein [uncultured Pseudomonas sp.]